MSELKIGSLKLWSEARPSWYKFEGAVFVTAENGSRCLVWIGPEMRTSSEAQAAADAALFSLKADMRRDLLGKAGDLGSCEGCARVDFCDCQDCQDRPHCKLVPCPLSEDCVVSNGCQQKTVPVKNLLEPEVTADG